MASKRFRPFSSKSAIVCRYIGKVWGIGTSRAHEALRAIDLDVEAGEFVVLLGPSGCGKSTLLYLIAGLEEASAGQIWSFGELIEGPSPERSLIFQETSLFPWLSVWQNVSFGLSIRHMSVGERHSLVDMMGDKQYRSARLAPDVDEKILHLRARLHVERGKRLVHEQNLGPHR